MTDRGIIFFHTDNRAANMTDRQSENQSGDSKLGGLDQQ